MNLRKITEIFSSRALLYEKVFFTTRVLIDLGLRESHPPLSIYTVYTREKQHYRSLSCYSALLTLNWLRGLIANLG